MGPDGSGPGLVVLGRLGPVRREPLGQRLLPAVLESAVMRLVGPVVAVDILGIGVVVLVGGVGPVVVVAE